VLVFLSLACNVLHDTQVKMVFQK